MIIKTFRVLYSVGRLFLKPERLENVMRLVDAFMNQEYEEAVAKALCKDDILRGRMIERPRLGAIDRQFLASLPEGTLGREFLNFIVRNQIFPEQIPVIEANNPAAYIKAYLYETHDIYHVLTGFEIDKPAELGIQAFYAAQLPSKHALLLLGLSILDTIFFHMHEHDARFRAIVRGWLLGKSSDQLFGIKWTDHWATPVVQLRLELGLNLEKVDGFIPRTHEKFLNWHAVPGQSLLES